MHHIVYAFGPSLAQEKKSQTEKYNTESATKVKYENVTAENERRTADKEKLMYSGKLRTNFSLG